METESQQPKEKTKLVDKQYVVHLQNRLGGGAYSQVYDSVLKSNPNIHLACKIISKDGLESQIMNGNGTAEEKEMRRLYVINRIRSEVKIAQKIKHDNIVQFKYTTETSKNIYIFMELCETTLEALVRTYGPLPEIRALPLIRDLLSAACMLYDNNITHRDIKAQNVLMKDGRLKLADFGFAKELAVKDACEGGTGVGTLYYMAPELVFEERPQYSIKCDVWSIGVLVYYMLYGHLPWDTSLDIKNYRLALLQPLQFPNTLEVSPRLKNLIASMLMFRDEERIHIKTAKMELEDLIESA